MRILLKVLTGKYVLSPESPEQNSYFWVSLCPVGFSSPYSTLSFPGRISIYGGFYCNCCVCVWTVKCSRNSISWHSLSLLMTSAGKLQKLYRSGFICSGLTLFPIKVVRVGLWWCQWDSIHPILRCLWPLYLSRPHTCSGDRQKQGHAEKWEFSKHHWGQREGCAQCFSRSGSPAWNTCVPAGLDCPWAGVAFASWGEN